MCSNVCVQRKIKCTFGTPMHASMLHEAAVAEDQFILLCWTFSVGYNIATYKKENKIFTIFYLNKINLKDSLSLAFALALSLFLTLSHWLSLHYLNSCGVFPVCSWGTYKILGLYSPRTSVSLGYTYTISLEWDNISLLKLQQLVFSHPKHLQIYRMLLKRRWYNTVLNMHFFEICCWHKTYNEFILKKAIKQKVSIFLYVFFILPQISYGFAWFA